MVKARRITRSLVAFSPRAAVHRPRERASCHALLAALGLASLLLAACSRDLPRSMQTVDGMTIYLGVIPAELVRGHSTAPGDPQALHGGTPLDRSSHHIVVALFDAKSGARVTDAEIRAAVRDRSGSHASDAVLAPMEINGAMSYGNFFLMEGTGLWRIQLEIRRPGAAHPVAADFAYEHKLDH